MKYEEYDSADSKQVITDAKDSVCIINFGPVKD